MDGTREIDPFVSRTHALEAINEGVRRMLSGVVARGGVVVS